MNAKLKHELDAAIKSDKPLDEIVVMLRQYKGLGVTQGEVYSFLEALRQTTRDDAMDDRILEIADFVVGFCAPHMKVWEGEKV